MNIGEALLACGRPEVRAGAEAQLAEAERCNPAQFVLSCSAALCDQRGPPYARQLAGILLKKAVGTGEPCAKGRQLTRRWTSIDDAAKGQVRNACLEGLLDPAEGGVRRIAALCVARIGAVDVPSGCWQEAVPTLAGLAEFGCTAAPPGLPEATILQRQASAEEAMRALGFLAEEWWAQQVTERWSCHMKDNFGHVHAAADHALRISARGLHGAPSSSMRIAAARAVYALMPFAVDMENGSTDTITLMTAILQNCGPDAPLDLRIEALRCLACCVANRYERLNASILDELTRTTLHAITSSPEQIAIHGLEVWACIAEHELGMLRSSVEHTCYDATRKALPLILPALLEALARQPAGTSLASDDFDDDTDFSVSEIASSCLSAVARIVADACVNSTLAFVEINLQSNQILRKRAALLAFGAIQDGPSAGTMTPIIAAFLPHLLETCKAKHFLVAGASAWAFGRALDCHPFAVPDTVQATSFELILPRLTAEPRIAEEICYCLDCLMDQQAATLPAMIFRPVAEALLEASTRATTDRTRVAILRTLAELVARVGEECVSDMPVILLRLLSWAQTVGGGKLPDGIVSCLRALILRLNVEQLIPNAEPLLSLFINLSKFSFESLGGFDEETLRAIGSLAVRLGGQFEAALPSLWPLLQKAMQDFDDLEGCLASILAFQDVATTLGPALGAQHSLEALGILASLLQKVRDCEQDKLRSAAITCIGKLVLALGVATPNLPAIMALLSDEVTHGLAMPRGDMPQVSVPTGGMHMRREMSTSGLSRTRRLPLPPRLELEQASRKAVLDALLGAYEDIVRGYKDTAELQRLHGYLLGIIRFALFHSQNFPKCQQTTRAVIRLLGMLAQPFHAAFAELLASDHNAQDCVSNLIAFGTVSPNKTVRDATVLLKSLLLPEAHGLDMPLPIAKAVSLT